MMAPKEKNPSAVALAKLSAASLTPAQRKRRAKVAALARWRGKRNGKGR